jgi:hypothetical protein
MDDGISGVLLTGTIVDGFDDVGPTGTADPIWHQWLSVVCESPVFAESASAFWNALLTKWVNFLIHVNVSGILVNEVAFSTRSSSTFTSDMELQT